MPDLSPRPAPRLVDHMNDAKGYDVAFFADRDAILIRHLGSSSASARPNGTRSSGCSCKPNARPGRTRPRRPDAGPPVPSGTGGLHEGTGRKGADVTITDYAACHCGDRIIWAVDVHGVKLAPVNGAPTRPGPSPSSTPLPGHGWDGSSSRASPGRRSRRSGSGGTGRHRQDGEQR